MELYVNNVEPLQQIVLLQHLMQQLHSVVQDMLQFKVNVLHVQLMLYHVMHNLWLLLVLQTISYQEEHVHNAELEQLPVHHLLLQLVLVKVDISTL